MVQASYGQTAGVLMSLHICAVWPQGYKAFFMLKSAEHEIYFAY